MRLIQTSPRRQTVVLAALAALLLLAFWLRIANLNIMPPGLSNDEAVNTVDAFNISRTGNFPMYEDPNRPEPLYRILLAGTSLLFGASVWAFRIPSALLGVLTIAAVYQTTCECLRDLPPNTRRLAAFAAAAALTVALGHITQSRIIERGIMQPPFMLFFASFLLRGIRTGRRIYYAISGVSLGISFYTYTAALVIPGSLVFAGLSLLIFRRITWHKWLLGLVLLGIIFAVIVAPIGVLFLRNPSAVLGRAAEVQQSSGILNKFVAFWGQFFKDGDENPQYNVASAPVLPPIFMFLFVIGIPALLVRIRQPSSWLIAALLGLSSIPVIASNELTHGLRIMGEFAAFPLAIGAGVGMLLVLLGYLPNLRRVAFASAAVALGALTLADGVYAYQTYTDYWRRTDLLWNVHNRELPHGEWFYRTDRRDLSLWMAAQHQPLLVALDELSWETVHTWLMPSFPNVTTASDDFQLPPNTKLVVTWALETGDLRRDTRHYALLNDQTITLLPPLSTETHNALLNGIDQAQAITHDGEIKLVARVKVIPNDFKLVYEPRTISVTPIAVFGDHELQLVGWRGADTLATNDAQTLTYTLDWQGLKRMGHEYSSYLQLQTQDYQKVAGDDVRILRWLFPTTVWQPGDLAPDVHTLSIPANLSPGAYRLVVGVYPFVTPTQHLPVSTGDGTPIGDSVTIGWVKVPPPAITLPTQGIVRLDATLDDQFALRGASAQALDTGKVQITLYWQSLVERPPIDATIFIHITNGKGEQIAQDDERPNGGQYPTFIWGKGEIVKTTHVIDPGSTATNDLQILVGMYTFPTLDRLRVIQDGKPVDDNRARVGKLVDLLALS